MTMPRPQAGDILVSELVKKLARSRHVNGWFTNDQTHCARIVSYRS
jgi:hypothetical protein